MIQWQKRAEASIAQACCTFSKRPDQFVEGVYPTHCVGTSNGIITTAEGEKLIDWVCALGANNNGNSNISSLPSMYEVELAEKLKEVFHVDLVKFLKTGSEACSAALRFARAYTGRKQVYGIGYHGYLNEFISEEYPGAGTIYQHYTKLESISDLIAMVKVTQPAAVILEPVILDYSPEHATALTELRDLCREREVLFIADEIVSSMRVPMFSISNLWGLDPDIIVLGKALAGHAISVVGGRRDILNATGTFISTTYGGEIGPIKAALAELNTVTEKKLEDLWNNGENLMRGFNRIAPKVVKLIGYATRMTWESSSNEMLALFWQEMLYKGHLLGRSFFVSHTHTEPIIDSFLEDAREVLHRIVKGDTVLKGLPPRPIFKRY